MNQEGNTGFYKKIRVSFLQIFSGETYNLISGFISSYFYALFLGPAVYGVWQTAKVFLNYSAIFEFSLPFVMRRDFVMLRGEGEYEKAERMSNLVLTYLTIVSLFATTITVFIALYFVKDLLFKYSLITVALLFSITIISGYGNILTKGMNNYKLLTWSSIIMGTSALIALPFVYYFGFYALLIGLIVANIINAVFYFIKRPFHYKWYWNSKWLWSLIIIAFPLYLEQISKIIFSSIDRLLIASLLSFKDVGLYSLAAIVATPVTLMVNSGSIVLFTHLNERYGRSKEKEVILKHVDIPQKIMTWIVPPVFAIGVILLPVLTKIFLPKYELGIIAAQISVFGTFFYAIAGYSANALFVLNKQKSSATIFIISGVIKIAGSVIAIKMGYGIAGVAFSTVLAYFFYDNMMLWIIYRHLKMERKQYLKRVVDKLLPIFLITIFFIVDYNLHQDVSNVENIINSKFLISLGLLVLLILPIVYIGYLRIKPYLVKK